MIAPQHFPQRHFLEKIRRPILFAAAGFASLITGFAGAALFDKNASLFIRAEGDMLDEGPNAGSQRSAVQGDPDVWPPLEYSFPQVLDVLSPEPLMSPVGSMNPPVQIKPC